MKVAIVAPSDFAGHPVGGTSTFLATVVPLLRCELGLFGVETAGTHPPAGADAPTAVRMVGRIDPASPVPDRLQRAVVALRAARQVRDWAPDVLYVHSAETAAVLGPRVGAPMVYHIHGGAAAIDATHTRYWFARNRLGSALLRSVGRAAVRRSSLVLGVSEDCGQLPAELSVPFELVPSCVDTGLFAPAPRVESGELVLGFVGRLAAVKNLTFIAEVLGSLAGRGVPARWLVAGDGPERSSLEAYVSARGLSDRVSFEGVLTRDRLPGLYARMDALVLSSHFEGLPSAVLEAMACGVPVVAPALPGIAAAVRTGVDGELFGERDVEAVGRLIERASQRRASYGAAARQRVLERYSASVVAAKLETLLEGVWRESGRASEPNAVAP